jgi:hypothetical protein
MDQAAAILFAPVVIATLAMIDATVGPVQAAFVAALLAAGLGSVLLMDRLHWPE